jgi:hypothetical protein
LLRNVAPFYYIYNTRIYNTHLEWASKRKITSGPTGIIIIIALVYVLSWMVRIAPNDIYIYFVCMLIGPRGYIDIRSTWKWFGRNQVIERAGGKSKIKKKRRELLVSFFRPVQQRVIYLFFMMICWDFFSRGTVYSRHRFGVERYRSTGPLSLNFNYMHIQLQLYSPGIRKKKWNEIFLW